VSRFFVSLVYEDGNRTPWTEVEFSDDDGPGFVTIRSTDNGTVVRAEVKDASDQLTSTTPVNMFMRVTDSIRITVMPPVGGWPSVAFQKEVDEAEVAEMRERLMAMADRLRVQQGILISERAAADQIIRRGSQNMPTGGYL
jgi:hypothetical protein